MHHDQNLPSDKEPETQEIEQAFKACEPPLTLGSCILRNPKAAEIVQKALLHFEGERYRLSAWCIMPNHTHVVLTPLEENRLSNIIHSWKSFTANQINKAIERKGALWERESFDHLIRTGKHLERFILYTENNPVTAGLCERPQDWPFSSCSAGFQPALAEFIEPYSTPCAEMRSRGELPHLEKPTGTYFVTFRLADAVKSE